MNAWVNFVPNFNEFHKKQFFFTVKPHQVLLLKRTRALVKHFILKKHSLKETVSFSKDNEVLRIFRFNSLKGSMSNSSTDNSFLTTRRWQFVADNLLCIVTILPCTTNLRKLVPSKWTKCGKLAKPITWTKWR